MCIVSTANTSVLPRKLTVKNPKDVPALLNFTANRQVDWHSLHDEFVTLANEQTEIIRATRKERLMADFGFADPIPTLQSAIDLNLHKGPDEHIRAQTEVLATKAAIALGCPRDVPKVKFWLFELFCFLQTAKSQHLFSPIVNTQVGNRPVGDSSKPFAGQVVCHSGGIITDVCSASAIFCLWLETKALVSPIPSRADHAIIKPTAREIRIWEIIQRGSSGRIYCRELDHAGITPVRRGVWADGPRKYVAAYDLGAPWRHRIEDEKYKITQKAKLANQLAGE